MGERDAQEVAGQDGEGTPDWQEWGSGEKEEASVMSGLLSQHLSWVSSQPASAPSCELPAKAALLPVVGVPCPD